MTYTPMKPCKIKSIEELTNYPYYAMIKYDGVRCITTSKGGFSAAGKRFANKWLNEQLAKLPPCLDMEILLKQDDEVLPCNEIVGFVNSINKVPENGQEIELVIFDYIDMPCASYRQYSLNLSLKNISQKLDNLVHARQASHLLVKNLNQAELFVCSLQQTDAEGVIFKQINSLYKHGRVTAKEQNLVALKFMADAEAKIVDYEFTKEPKRDELIGTGGAFICEGINEPFEGVQFRVAIPTYAMKNDVPYNWKKYKGRIITYKYMATGNLTKPRQPILKGFRDNMV